jgi:hypothetical protein
MIATHTLSTNRLATSAPAMRSQLDPRWNKARELFANARRFASEFADEIDRLRAEYLGEGHGGDRRSHQESHGETLDRNEGFKAAVARELGISPATAYRYLATVKAVGICQQIEQAPEGEVIELEQGGSYEVTEEIREKARQLREEIVTGGVPMNRALPAVAGMFNVQGGGTGGKEATNHPANTWAGLQKLRTSLKAKHWRQGKMAGKADWDKAVDEWASLLRQLPDELRATTAAWVQKGMPRNER